MYLLCMAFELMPVSFSSHLHRNSIATGIRATFQWWKSSRKVSIESILIHAGTVRIQRVTIFYFVFRREEAITRKSVRPFSQYANEIKYKNAHTEKENFGFADDGVNKSDNKTVMNGGGHSIHWYRDVVELRKKAEQYRVSAITFSRKCILINSSHFNTFRIVVGVVSKSIPICITSKKTFGSKYRVAVHCLPYR